MSEKVGSISVPKADYLRLFESALDGHDDMLVICETCGAWLDRNDPATATTDDYTGCWKMATGQERYTHLCRSDRGATLEVCRTTPKDGER